MSDDTIEKIAKLSDEELIDKTTLLRSRLTYASRFASYEMVAALENLILLYEMEQRSRLEHEMFKLRNSMFPDVIDSEPPQQDSKNSLKVTNTRTKNRPPPVKRTAVPANMLKDDSDDG